jgi:hypothetical protein
MRQVFICLSPRTCTPPPHYTLYTFLQYSTQYLFNIHTGTGGQGELNQREGYRGNSSQSWVENTNMTDFKVSL